MLPYISKVIKDVKAGEKMRINLIKKQEDVGLGI
jgi:hypothetical protein